MNGKRQGENGCTESAVSENGALWCSKTAKGHYCFETDSENYKCTGIMGIYAPVLSQSYLLPCISQLLQSTFQTFFPPTPHSILILSTETIWACECVRKDGLNLKHVVTSIIITLRGATWLGALSALLFFSRFLHFACLLPLGLWEIVTFSTINVKCHQRTTLKCKL